MATDKCSSGSLLLDPYWSGGHYWGPSTDFLALENEALARALGASMVLPNPEASAVDTTPCSSSMSSSFFTCSPSPTGSSSTFTGATRSTSPAGSPFPPPSRSASGSPRPIPPPPPPPGPQPGAVTAGRVTKRKPRRSSPSSSKRSPIAYIEADPARFREMVQQMTGFETTQVAAPPAVVSTMMQSNLHSQLQLMAQRTMTRAAGIQIPGSMPTLDTSMGFVDTVDVPEQHRQQILSSTGIVDNSFTFLFPELNLGDELLMAIPEFGQEQERQRQQQLPEPQPQPPCFPTLESWSD